jgi:hypothetical protein
MRAFKILLFSALVLVLALVAGCGGGSVTGLAGNWSGTFTTSGGQSGTITAFLTSGGLVSGTIHNNTTGQDGSISGSVQPGTSTTLNFIYSSTTSTATGNLTFTSKQLNGTVVDTSGTTYTIALTQS